jgi:hypothetical protein
LAITYTTRYVTSHTAQFLGRRRKDGVQFLIQKKSFSNVGKQYRGRSASGFPP